MTTDILRFGDETRLVAAPERFSPRTMSDILLAPPSILRAPRPLAHPHRRRTDAVACGILAIAIFVLAFAAIAASKLPTVSGGVDFLGP